jgi:hypothetical protein
MGTGTRYRCAACGNLTRFDVDARRRTREFLHFSLAGEPTVEEEEILEETIEKVTCRWCGSSEQIETVPAVNAQEGPA